MSQPMPTVAADETFDGTWPFRARYTDAPRLDPLKTQTAQIKLIDKDIDHPNRIVFADPVLQSLGKQGALIAIYALDKTLHHGLPSKDRRIIAPAAFLHSLDPFETFSDGR